MDVCAACGVIAPERRTSCDACEAPFPSPRMQVATRHDDAYWVAVRCQLGCRACGFLTPLNELDTDGSVTCARCGIDQAFAVEEWAPAFQHAHDVGDLAGPNPNGRKPAVGLDIGAQNPFKTTGVKHSAASSGERGGRTVVSASPGHPLCPRCHVPLEMPLDAVAVKQCRGTASCPECKESLTYDLPKNARALYPDLRLVLAEGNRADQKHVVFQAGSAGQAVVVRCPNCTADLPPLEPKARHVTCAYCKVASFIPARAWARLVAEAPPIVAWWLLFRGPSPMRITLEERARDELRKEEHTRNQREWARAKDEKESQEREREEAERRARDAEETREREERELAERKITVRNDRLGIAWVIFLIAGFGSALAYSLLRDESPVTPPPATTKPELHVKPVLAPPAVSAKGHVTHGAAH